MSEALLEREESRLHTFHSVLCFEANLNKCWVKLTEPARPGGLAGVKTDPTDALNPRVSVFCRHRRARLMRPRRRNVILDDWRRPERDFVALALLERALFACSREDAKCKNAVSLCLIPTERSFRCASDIVSPHQSLSQVYDFGSRGCRFEPCRVHIKYQSRLSGDSDIRKTKS